MGWVLAAAVIAAVAWIAVIVGGRIAQSDRRRVLQAQAQAHELAAAAAEAARDGGCAEQPIEVMSASQIEPKVEREPCPRCGGRFHVDAHEATTVSVRNRDPEALRRVAARCGGCGTMRVTWFRVRPAVLA